jgi:[protein-PII] uridylyltransferase
MTLSIPESIQEHADERLAAHVLGPRRRAQIDAFRRFLGLETQRLRMRHRSGAGGLQIASIRSHQVDVLLTRVCRLVDSESSNFYHHDLEKIAVVALGGYGRAELAPSSDVDLLFLHSGKASDEVRPFTEEVLKLLWDVGLQVGHSFRSARECVSEARDDLHSRTALTEARLVCGSAPLFEGLQETLASGLGRDQRSREAFLESMRVELAERRTRFGAVALQEPNVKEGIGGLRDLHAILWIGYAVSGKPGLAGLQAAGLLSPAEGRVLNRCREFLTRVRNELHFSTARKSDLLTLDVQEGLAAALGYEAHGGLQASEVFMREFYRRSSEMNEVCRTFMLRHLAPPPGGLLASLRPRRFRGSLEVKDGRLHARGPGLEGGALQIMETFATAQAEGIPLSDDLKQEIRAKLHLVDKRFRESREAVAAFLHVLARRGRVGPALRAMHETGFLGRFLPEWARITFLVQHDFYHRYTVDEHTLRAVEALDTVAIGQDRQSAPFGRFLDEVTDAAPLYLGMLLHDIGKGRDGKHVEHGVRIATKIVERLKLDPKTGADALFLVARHLEMSQVSQQRDLSEDSLIDSFAQRMGSIERLDLLMLLTYADHCAVAPGIWNEWKGSLLFELYRRTRAKLAGSAEEEGLADAARAAAADALRAEFPASEIERHFAMLPERYLRNTDTDHMVRHFRLLASRGDAPVLLEWQDLEDEHCTELTVTAADRPGFFAKVAGSLTANGINVLAVDLFSREDGVVIDTFKLSEQFEHLPVRLSRRTGVAALLEDAVSGRKDVAEAVDHWLSRNPRKSRRRWGRAARGPSVRFDDEASASATVVEVRALDRPGLAFTIASTLAGLGLDITFAKVATDRSLALDVLYVTEGGRKLLPGSSEKVEQCLLSVLDQDAVGAALATAKGEQATKKGRARP